MRRNYVAVAEFLQTHFQHVQVEGGNYPPPPVVEWSGQILWALQALGLLWALLGGDRLLILARLTRRDPQNPHRHILPNWYYTIQESRIQIGVALFLLAPQFLAKYTITGAFEVTVGDTLVWSKLQYGRFPTQDELLQAFQALGVPPRGA